MKSKISKILITVGLLICVGSLSIKGYSKYLENKSTKSFEEKIDNQPVEVEYKEENTSDDYNDDVSEKNDEDIERKRMLEEYFADQDGKDTKVKRTKTKGKHF